MDHFESQRIESDDSFIGGDDYEEKWMEHSESLVKASIESGSKVRIKSGDDQRFVGARLKSGKGTYLESEGDIALKAKVLNQASHYSYDSEGKLIDEHEGRGFVSKSVHETIPEGGVSLNATGEVSADINADGSDLLPYLKHQDVKLNAISPEHKAYDYDVTVLNEGGRAFVTIAATALTAGAASGAVMSAQFVANTALNTALQAGVMAGTTSLAQNASVSFVNNQGHIGRTVKDMGSKNNVKAVTKSFVIGAATAGITDKLGLNIEPETFQEMSKMGQFTNIGQKMLVSETISTGLGDGDFKKMPERFGQNFGMAVVHNLVGDVGQKHGMAEGGFGKTVMHAASAGAMAAARGDDFGVAAGAEAASQMVGSKLSSGPASKEIAGLTAASTSIILGGNAKSISRSSKTAMSAHEYNRELHDDERTIANALKQGKSEEEQLIIDGAAAASVKMNKSVKGSDDYSQAVETLVEIGKAHPEVQESLRAKAQEMGYKDAFKYSKWDAFTDKFARNDEGIKRSIGAVTAVQGIEMAAIGAGAMAVNAAAPPVAIGPIGYGMVGMGSAVTAAGIERATGEYHSIEGARVLQSIDTHAPSYLKLNAVEYTVDALGLGGAKAITHLGGKATSHAAKVEARLRVPSNALKTPAPKHDVAPKVNPSEAVSAESGAPLSLLESERLAYLEMDAKAKAGILHKDMEFGSIKGSSASIKAPKAAKSAQINYPTTKMSAQKGGGLKGEAANGNVAAKPSTPQKEMMQKGDKSGKVNVLAKDVIKENPHKARHYVKEVEEITGRPVHPTQKKLLKEDLKVNEYSRLDPVTKLKHRDEFNSKRDVLRKEWEINTGQKWPKYEKEVMKDGVTKIEEIYYDGHHMNPVSHGGPNEWWNIHPAFPKDHSVIHGSGSEFRGIFNKVVKE